MRFSRFGLFFLVVVIAEPWCETHADRIESTEADDPTEIIDTTAKFDSTENAAALVSNKPVSLVREPQSILFIKPKLKSIDLRYDIGFYLATGGLTTVFVLPSVGSYGALAYHIGLPTMGAAAGQANSLALKVSPEYRDPGSGWGFYAAGITLTTVGSIWLIYELVTHIAFVGPLPVLTGGEKNVYTLPLLTIGTGVICQGVSWYKFSARHRKARKAILNQLEAQAL